MVTVLSNGSDDDDDDGGGGNLEPNEEGYIEIGPLNFYYDKDYTSTDNKTNLRIQFAGEADSDEFGIIDNWKASPNTKLQSWGSGLIADISDLPAGRDSIYIKGTYKGIKYQFNANIVATPGMFHDSIYDFDPATGKFNYRDNTVDLGAVPAIISMREYAPNPYFPDETVKTGDCSVYITMDNYDFKPDRWTYNNLSDGQQTIKEGVDVIGLSCTDDSYCASNVSVWVDGTTYSFVISPTKEDDQFQQKYCTNVRVNAKEGSLEYKYDNHMISW